MSDASDVLGALASGLAADTGESGKKALEVLRARSPELFTLSEESGEDLVATSVSFIDVLLASLRVDEELPWNEYDQRARAHGCAQRGRNGCHCQKTIRFHVSSFVVRRA